MVLPVVGEESGQKTKELLPGHCLLRTARTSSFVLKNRDAMKNFY